MIHRLVSWTKAICRFLAKVLCTLAMPIRHNWVFVLMMLLMLSLCIWREWIYQVDTALHYWHFCFDIYLLCIFLMLFRHNIRRYVKFLLYGIAYLSTFFEIFIMERFQVIFTPTTINLWRETNAEETREFFLAYFTGSAFWITSGLLLLTVCIHILLSKLEDWKAPRPYLLKLLSSFCIVLITILSISPTLGEKELLCRFFSSSEQAEKVKSELFYSPVYRIVYSLCMLHVADQDLDDLSMPIPKAMVAQTTCIWSFLKSSCVRSRSAVDSPA